MLEPKQNADTTDSHMQSFVIRYDYPVYFTRDMFDPDNPCLTQALARIEPDKRQRMAMFVDEGVIFAMPDLLPRMARYAHASSRSHGDRRRRGGRSRRRGGEEPA